MVAVSLSHHDQFIGSEWTLARLVVDKLGRRCPVLVDLFTTFLSYHLSMFFPHLCDPMAAGTDAFLQSWVGRHDYVFPPFTLSRRAHHTSFLHGYSPHFGGYALTTEEWFPELRSLAVAPLVAPPLEAGLLSQPQLHCLHHTLLVLQLHAWSCAAFCATLGPSRSVARQLSLCHHSSSRRLYQHQ